jgi:hypothetical protein
MTQKTETTLSVFKRYTFAKSPENQSLMITLPKIFVEDNNVRNADTEVVVYRNSLNPSELVVRVEKANQD